MTMLRNPFALDVIDDPASIPSAMYPFGPASAPKAGPGRGHKTGDNVTRLKRGNSRADIDNPATWHDIVCELCTLPLPLVAAQRGISLRKATAMIATYWHQHESLQ
jgi:hypothetical protein